MSPIPSVVSASFVARQVGYRMDKGWAQGEAAVMAWFSGLETYEERLDALLREIGALGFGAVELWAPHLHWRWATDRHVAIARRVLERRGMAVRSYAGWIPGGPEELRAACRLCRALGMPIFAGYSELFATDRAAAVSILREHGIRYAYENHSDRSAAEVASHLGAGDEDVVGVAFDTGWCGTHGWDPLELLREHGSRVLAVHLKDVKARRAERTGLELVDMGHESCRLGEGIVPVRAVVAALRKRGFPGPVALEHEPELFDPGEDLRAGLRTFLGWWKEA